MAKVDTILSRTTIISQSVLISYWPNKLMVQCIVGQKKMYNLSSLLKIRLSLWLFLSYLMNVLSLWLYLWKKVFIRKLIGLPWHPPGSPPFLSSYCSFRTKFVQDKLLSRFILIIWTKSIDLQKSFWYMSPSWIMYFLLLLFLDFTKDCRQPIYKL